MGTDKLMLHRSHLGRQRNRARRAPRASSAVGEWVGLWSAAVSAALLWFLPFARQKQKKPKRRRPPHSTSGQRRPARHNPKGAPELDFEAGVRAGILAPGGRGPSGGLFVERASLGVLRAASVEVGLKEDLSGDAVAAVLALL